METYVILFKSPERGEASGELLKRFGEANAGGGNASRLATVQLEPAEAADAARAPEVAAITSVMATRLIKPFDASAANTDEIWGIDAVGAAACPLRGRGVKVAVLDTGIEKSHPAFNGVTLQERDFSSTGDGDKQGHGTHCAGTIFGRDVGGVRIGIATGVTTALIGKVLRDDGSGTSVMIFDGLKWAIDQGAHVISMSLGFDFPGQVAERVRAGWPEELATSLALESYRANLKMFEAIMATARANKSFGTEPLVVAAAGNESQRNRNPNFRIAASLPSSVSDLSVGAIGRSGAKYEIAEFSNSNPDVVAPGVDIRSAWPSGGLKTISGTSMACPHVAGVASLWIESLRESGKDHGVAAVRSHLIAKSRTDVFAGKIDKADFGQGLIISP